ncbi:hypothetical protein EVAR_40525_1 [Eumeta japonica]|uniref:Uncharacterized protein n=1 Tax=Eumeta variegata TaxID=151549 RepID=A0A4C1XV47_EUMVA|nr:hypothetical protein EVAR_40525_1 [Eumeta japonica]
MQTQPPTLNAPPERRTIYGGGFVLSPRSVCVKRPLAVERPGQDEYSFNSRGDIEMRYYCEQFPVENVCAGVDPPPLCYWPVARTATNGNEAGTSAYNFGIISHVRGIMRCACAGT